MNREIQGSDQLVGPVEGPQTNAQYAALVRPLHLRARGHTFHGGTRWTIFGNGLLPDKTHRIDAPMQNRPLRGPMDFDLDLLILARMERTVADFRRAGRQGQAEKPAQNRFNKSFHAPTLSRVLTRRQVQILDRLQENSVEKGKRGCPLQIN